MHNLKRKYISGSNFTWLIDKKYSQKIYDDHCFDGVVSLTEILQVSKPIIIVDHKGKQVKLADVGYKWLRFAFRDKNYWLTVMFDENDHIVEFYFDITTGSVIEEDGNAWYLDLFLDVVMDAEGNIALLDENELDEALDNGAIDAEQHKFAHDTANFLVNEISGRHECLRAFATKYYQELRMKPL